MKDEATPKVGEERQVFTWVRWQWDIATAAALVQEAGLPVGRVSLAGVRTMFNLGFITVDREHATTVDVTAPVIVAPLPNADGWLVIDGWHRVWRALQLGLEELTAYYLDEELSTKAQVHRSPGLLSPDVDERWDLPLEAGGFL